MNFVDMVKIYVKSGDGGKGCESFYKDNYMRFPRPDGGDGGDGGSIIIRGKKGLRTLLDYRFQQHYKAGKGKNASSKGKTGARGKDLILEVPLGTLIFDEETKLLIRDIVEEGQQVTILKGAIGGLGNKRRKYTKPPGKGEEKTIRLDLKVIADVGLIGFPNVGKSTLISVIARVKSKIAQYPFTTKQPILGYVSMENDSFIVADLPGIIEGASEGKGLGFRFLRHTERTKILVHMIDMASMEGRDPYEDYLKITKELQNYGNELKYKKVILVANKMDSQEAEENLIRFKKKYDKEIYILSAKTKRGIKELLYKIREEL